MNSSGSLWLGYSRLGGRFGVKLDEVGKGIAMLGHGSNDLAPLVALACEEAGLRALILDIGGVVSSRLSGYVDEYGWGLSLSTGAYDVLSVQATKGFARSFGIYRKAQAAGSRPHVPLANVRFTHPPLL